MGPHRRTNKTYHVWSDSIDFGYTDLCVLVSATLKSAWDYYLKLQQVSPEYLLGYNICLVTPDSVQRLRGLRIRQFYIDYYTWQICSRDKVDRILEELDCRRTVARLD